MNMNQIARHSAWTTCLTAAAFSLALTITQSRPALAQDGAPPPITAPESGQMADDSDLEGWLGQGAQDLLGGLLREMEPQMADIGRQLGQRFDELSPILSDLGRMMDDIANYQAPERLENGDILIRRKPGAPPPPVVSPRTQELIDRDPDRDTDRDTERDLGRDLRPAPDPAPLDRPLDNRPLNNLSGADEVEL